MSSVKLPAPKKRRGPRLPPEAPFPVPVESFGGEPVADDNWNYYTGDLLADHVLVRHSGDMDFLYKMGFFGKGNLSRNKPEYNEGFWKIRKKRRDDSQVFRVMSKRQYLSHLSWKAQQISKEPCKYEPTSTAIKLTTGASNRRFHHQSHESFPLAPISPSAHEDKTKQALPTDASHNDVCCDVNELQTEDASGEADQISPNSPPSVSRWDSVSSAAKPEDVDPWAVGDAGGAADFWGSDDKNVGTDFWGDTNKTEETDICSDTKKQEGAGLWDDTSSKEGADLGDDTNKKEVADFWGDTTERKGDQIGERKEKERDKEGEGDGLHGHHMVGSSNTGVKVSPGIPGEASSSSVVPYTSSLHGVLTQASAEWPNSAEPLKEKDRNSKMSGANTGLAKASTSQIDRVIAGSKRAATIDPLCLSEDQHGDVYVVDDTDDSQDEREDDDDDGGGEGGGGGNDERRDLGKWIPTRKADPRPLRECLQLTFEEAFFLSYGLGCLVVLDEQQEPLGLKQMWQVFRERRDNFVHSYVAYHSLRSRGWVPKTGIKYGADFVLYHKGPPFFHGSYSVLVQAVAEDELCEDLDPGKLPLSWRDLMGIHRVTEQVAKDPLLFYVIKPHDLRDEELSSPSCISRFTVLELLLKRWISSKERESADAEEWL